MSEPVTDTITRAEFDRRHHLGSAGETTRLDKKALTTWRKRRPDWQGKYWTLLTVDAVLRFNPINVTPRPRKTR
ncbi:hypothetical protein AB0H76_09880 [Nocardia sp. NPDC050712]|uniref:hypothetical protein n=1 Tax=Nocardia sp. NPDC050712 TaxID=3155518 RepID=UPI0033D60B58